MSTVQEMLILRAKWLAALESDEYEQCTGTLAREDAVCPLGLAQKMIIKSGVKIPPPYKCANGSFYHHSLNIEVIGKHLGLKSDAVTQIIQMNDGFRMSFKGIAAVIRNAPEEFFDDFSH